MNGYISIEDFLGKDDFDFRTIEIVNMQNKCASYEKYEAKKGGWIRTFSDGTQGPCCPVRGTSKRCEGCVSWNSKGEGCQDKEKNKIFSSDDIRNSLSTYVSQHIRGYVETE